MTRSIKKLPAERIIWIKSLVEPLCMSMIFTASAIYQVTTVGLNPLQLVLVGTALETTIFLFEVPTGIVADVYSRRLSMLIGLALIGVAFMVEGLVPFFGAVLVCQFLWGLGYTFTSGAREAWIVDEVGEAKMGEVFLRSSQLVYIGDLLGITGAALLGSIAVNLPIIVGAGFLLLLTLMLVVFMPETNFTPKATGLRNSWQAMTGTLRDSIKLIRVHPALLTIFGIGLFYGLYSEGFDRLSTAHMLKDMAVPALWSLTPIAWFSVFSVIGSGIGFGATALVRRFVKTNDTLRLTQVLFGLSALLTGGLLAFALAGDFFIAAIFFILIGGVRGLIGPLYGTWMNQRLDSGVRATVISMSGQVDAIGQIVGGPGVGWLGNVVSIPAALAASSFILSPILALYWRATRQSTVVASESEPIPALITTE